MTPLPCPFCGCKPRVRKRLAGGADGAKGCRDWRVQCEARHCGVWVATHKHKSREHAVDAWNRRRS